MRNLSFTVWAVMLSVGIAVSTFLFLPWQLSLGGMLLFGSLLLYYHRQGQNITFLVSSCAFFFFLGSFRAWSGDINLIPNAVETWASALSQVALARLHSVGLSGDASSLLDAMLLGQRGSLSSDMRHLYANVGASHVLALSGLHLGILFGLLNFWMMRVLTHRWVRYGIGVFSLSLIWGYTFLTGFSPSLTRASVMMTILLLSQMRLCGTDGWHALGLAAVTILFFAPSSLWNVGFQLSFASMTGLFLFYTPMDGLLKIKNRPLRWLVKGFLASLSAQLGGVPLVAFYFHQVSLYSVFFSPFYILMATFILYAAIGALAFGHLFAVLVNALVWAQHGLMHVTGLLPGALWDNLHPSLAAVTLDYMALFVGAYVLSKIPQKKSGAKYERWAMLFRQWPYLASIIILLLAAYLVG